MFQSVESKPLSACRANRLTQLCILLLCLAMPYSACTQQIPAELQPTDEVIELLLAGDWTALRNTLDSSFDPTNTIASLLLGHAFMNSNQNHKSLPLFLSFRDTAHVSTWANWCLKFREQYPDHPIALYLYADAMFRVGDYKTEKLTLDYAIRISKPMSYLFHLRGLLQIQLGAYDLAITDLDTALSIDSNFAEAYYHRGLCLFKMSKFELAAEEYRKAIQKNDQDIKSYISLASTLGLSDQHLEAIESATQALALDSTATFLHFQIGQSYEKLGQPVQAIESYEAFLKSYLPDGFQSMIKRAKRKIDSLRQAIKN